MAHVRTVPDHEARGALRRLYAEAIARAGKVFGIVRLMSLNPPVLRASMGLYQAVMFGPSPLSRRRRELLATVVSRANDCFYWTRAHGEDLRAEAEREGLTPAAAAALCEAATSDWRAADLDAIDRALCAFAERATRSPAAMGAADVEALRAVGLDDGAIHDATQVVAYFNYINRVADCLGVDLEPEMLRDK